MSQTYLCTQERFLKDAGKHTMTVIQDDGIHRHLGFRKPSPAGSEYWFKLITYPGELVITGDMGTCVFRRLEDMFEFFRADQKHHEKTGQDDTLGINPQYWGRKLQAFPKEGYKQFSAETFRANVKESFDNWVESNKPYADDNCEDCTKAQREAFDTAKADLLRALEDEVLNCADDGETRALDAASNFRWGQGEWEFEIQDIWEWDCKEYTFHFIWSCYAIAWSIQQYDQFKDQEKQVAREPPRTPSPSARP
jgi:hypothetical protein